MLFDPLVLSRFLTKTGAVTLSDSQNATAVCKYGRLGELAIGTVNVQWTGAAAGSAAFTVSLPDSLAMKTGSQAGGTSALARAATTCGAGTWFDNGTAYKMFTVEFSSATTFSFAVGSVLTADLFASGDGIKYFFIVPIEEWT